MKKINYVFLCSCTGSWFPRAWASLSCGASRAALHCVCTASHCSGFSCFGAPASRAEACAVVSHELVAHGTWNLPGPGAELTSPALVEANFLLLTSRMSKSTFFKVKYNTQHISWLNEWMNEEFVKVIQNGKASEPVQLIKQDRS